MKGVVGYLLGEYLYLFDLRPHLTKGSNRGIPHSGAREYLLHLQEMTLCWFLA